MPVQKELLYWVFAKNFGFRPGDVDKMPYDRVVYFLELQKELGLLEKKYGIKN